MWCRRRARTRQRFVPLMVAAWWSTLPHPQADRQTTCMPPRSRRDPRGLRNVGKDNLVETAVAAGSFTTLVSALEKAELVETFAGEGPFTVLAPVDEAFARLPDGALEELLADKDRLTAVLRHHVIPGLLTASTLGGVSAARTIDHGYLKVETSLGVRIGEAYLVQADIHSSNGIIHAIDSVLMPG